MRVILEADVHAQMRALPPGPRRALRDALRALQAFDGDRPPGLDVRRLQHPNPYFRVRVGEDRIVFTRQGQAQRVVKVFHRDEGYGWLERMR